MTRALPIQWTSKLLLTCYVIFPDPFHDSLAGLLRFHPRLLREIPSSLYRTKGIRPKRVATLVNSLAIQSFEQPTRLVGYWRMLFNLQSLNRAPGHFGVS